MRLRPGITLAFLVLVVPLNVGMIAFNYRQNVALAIEMAEAAMARVTQEVTGEVGSLLRPVGQAVEALAALAELDRHGLRHPDSQHQVFKALLRLHAATSLYAGFERDGAFYQVLRLRPGLERLGPDLAPVPPGAAFVARALEPAGGALPDSFTYLRDWEHPVGREAVAARYDPRQRRWYKAAIGDDGLKVSEVYAFSGTGSLGLTVSRRIMGGGESGPVGVAGADLSLASLSRFLERRRIGAQGVVFILDQEGGLIGHPRAEVTAAGGGTVVKAAEAADAVVAGAVKRRAAGEGDHFRAVLGDGGEEFLVAFHQIPAGIGRDWTIGIAAPVAEFVAPIQRASLVFLGVGILLSLTAALAAVLLARLITRPIQALILEADRIRHFDMAERPVVQSGIVDVDTLADSVDRMKSALRSFSAYVPKELVRQIIDSGIDTEVGGARRPVTVMFSDLRDFSRISEALAPEEVLDRLSRYFDVCSRAIHETGGVVDKFIGDAVMALWNAPSADEAHCLSACRAMLACIEAEKALNAGFVAEGREPFFTRFGLHTGNAVVGNVGSDDRMQYTALGAMVNLASRVEGLNKVYGTQALITGPVEAAVRGRMLVRLVDLVIPAGTSQPTPLFELVAAMETASEADIARCRRWDAAFAAYRARDWAAAAVGFEEYLVRRPGDLSALLLLERCRRYEAEPPPDDWNGAVRFLRK